MAYTLTIPIPLAVNQTGLILKAQLKDTAGVDVGSEVTSGFVEEGGGAYVWTYSGFPDSFRGYVRFYTGTAPGTLRAICGINPEEAENTDVKTSTRHASGAAVSSVTGAVGSVTGNVGGSIGSLAVQAKADVNAEADTALTDYDAPTNAEMVARTLASADYGTSANQTTILNRLGAFAGTGLNTILGFFRALLRKDAALTPSDVGGTFDNTTDSTEAIRDRGDVAWITGVGISAADIWAYADRQLTAFSFSVNVAAGGITASSFAAGAIDATAIATDALGSLELAAGAATEISDTIFATLVETGVTFKNFCRAIAATTAGRSSGFDTNNGTGFAVNNPSKQRFTVTMDGVGNRTALTWDFTD